MPPHDETSAVGQPAGSRRPPAPVREARSGGGGRRPGPPDPRRAARADRGRTTAARSGGASVQARRPAPKRKGKRTAKQKRRRVYKVLAALVAGAAVLLGVFVGVVYANTSVPTPDTVQQQQLSIVYYSDGVTEMARLGTENRTNVPLDQVSEPARQAVLAAENRNFYEDPGISVTGIARAAWNNLTGGSTQGGSTITQQYVGLAFLENGTSFREKFQELFLAVKLDNTVSKDEILESYLNAIYFGRGAYGIEAAAQTWFGVPASALTAQQGAVLSVLIRNPSFYDPASNPEGAQDRWGLVLDGMVSQGWLGQADRDASTYPEVLPQTPTNLNYPEGPEGLVARQVVAEVQQRYDQDVFAGGLRVVSTVDKVHQDAAVAAVADVMDGEPENLREALVSIDPRTGGVTAYYGGALGSGTDYAQAQRQPGSSMKPYVMAAALEEGIGINARRDGSSPQTFPDRPGLPVSNSGGASCGSCTLVQAMTRSLNTSFYGLAYEVGGETVRDVALAASGMPDVWEAGLLEGSRTLSDPETGATGGSIGIGQYEMRPIDQASGFATIANGGLRHEEHFVSSITTAAGDVVVSPESTVDAGTQAMSADVASDTTLSMEGVADYSRRGLDGDRPVASKTGTQGLNDGDNSDAWMVGFTPSLSVAVWMGNDSTSQPIVNADGGIVFGSGLPGAIWQQYMDTVLAGTPEEPLPTSAVVRGDTGNGVPAPQTTQAPRPTTQAPAPTTQAPAPTTPAPAPEPEPEPAPSPEPAPEPAPAPGTGTPVPEQPQPTA